MGPADRNSVEPLLAQTHRIWGWPDDPAGEPGPFTGPAAVQDDPWILSPDWRTGTTDDLDTVQDGLRVSNSLVDRIRLANGRISARGLGTHSPIASNDTEEGRRQNRRVEVIIEN